MFQPPPRAADEENSLVNVIPENRVDIQKNHVNFLSTSVYGVTVLGASDRESAVLLTVTGAHQVRTTQSNPSPLVLVRK